MMSRTLTAITLPLLFAAMLSVQAGYASPNNPGKEKKKTAATEQQEICRTLTYYYEGTNMKSTNAVEGALHPDAQITHLNTKSGQVEAMNVRQLLKSVSQGQAHRTANLRLLNLDVDGDAAMVKVRVIDANTGNRSVRYLHLVHTGNQWRIVNETAYQRS
ncbi:MAG: nuclear transport factor 2 family protein [Bacteroidota bacterium]